MLLNRKFQLAWLCLVVLLTANPLSMVAQDQPLEAQQQSVIAFDLKVEELFQVMKSFGAPEEQFESMPLESVLKGVDAKDISRLSGSASLPKTMAELETIAQGQIPLEFYLRFTFTNAEAVGLIKENIKTGSDKVEFEGQTLWTPKAGQPGAQGMYCRQVSDSAFEFGTKTYLLKKSRNFMTPQLAEAWKKMDAKLARIAIDMESPAELIEESIEMVADGAPPTMQAYFDLADNLKTVSLVIAPDTKRMVVLEGVGKDAEQAEEVQGALDSLFGMAKMGGGMVLNEFSEIPETQEMLGEMIESLEAKVDGNVVKFVLEKPDGFEEKIKKLSEYGESRAKVMIRTNNMRQVGLSILNYESAYQNFPFKREEDELGWRAHILPFMELSNLHGKLDFAEGPDGETNSEFAEKMPKIFGTDGKNANIVQIISDVNGFGDITDGSSNTVMLVEIPEGQPWLTNGGLAQADAVKLVANLKDGETILVVMYDCSCHTFKSGMDEELLRRFFDPADGEVVDWDF